MEDIIGIKVVVKKVGEVGFITWGRIFHPVDTVPICSIIKKYASKCGFVDLQSVELCETLQEVSEYPYFYEALFEFSQHKIPADRGYVEWQKSMQKKIEQGQEIYFLGLTEQQKRLCEVDLSGCISHGFIV